MEIPFVRERGAREIADDKSRACGNWERYYKAGKIFTDIWE